MAWKCGLNRSMPLCLAASLVETGTFDPKDQMLRYVRWRDEGYMSSTGRCFDIGGTVNAALYAFTSTDKPFSGPTGERSAGNGSIMRLAPVPVFYHREPSRAVRLSGESSRTTHGTKMAVDSCRYLGGLIVGAINGATKEELLSPMFQPVEAVWDSISLDSRVEQIARGEYKRKSPPA